MARPLGFLRGSLLALLPLATFFVGPVLAAFAREGIAARVLFSAMPTFLPLIALGVVALLAYRWTRSVKVAWLVTAAGFAIALVGAFVFLIAVWPSGH